MSASKDMFGFITGVALGAAGYYLITHPRYANELGTKVTDLIKTKLNDATPDTEINDPAVPEEGVTDGTSPV